MDKSPYVIGARALSTRKIVSRMLGVKEDGRLTRNARSLMPDSLTFCRVSASALSLTNKQIASLPFAKETVEGWSFDS